MAGPKVLMAGGGLPLVEKLAFGAKAPVVVMTASRKGASGFVKKLVNPSALRVLVEELVGPPGSAG